ncbi:hypothetical protein INT45_008058 [Circinella minor]|uniref:Pleckstrin homology domain-containing protein n=1 Tax=Circinella minor TaxID=1195481 RepID=A0A8H7S936_9FUNG|nr:hypothetical protein INT45_008058 [Circinella minor]
MKGTDLSYVRYYVLDQNKKNSQEIEKLAIAQNNDTNGVNQKRELRRSINAKQQQRQNAQSVKKQPSRGELLASEIGNNLVFEVRRLRGEIKESEAIRASELQKYEYAVQHRNQLEKHHEKMKDNIWSLELKNQELEQQLEIANTKVSRMTTENTRLEKQLDQIHNNTLEQHKVEQETNNTARRQLEHHRITLVKELRALKKENANIHQQLQTATTEVSLWKNKVGLLNNFNQPSILPPNPSKEEKGLGDEKATTTPPGSPPSIQAKNHEIKIKTLQNSLEYAQQTISDLQMTLDKEKLDRIETKKMLAENQEMIEELRRDALTNQSHRRKQQYRRQRARKHFNSKYNNLIRMDSSSSSSSGSDSASITDYEGSIAKETSERKHIRNTLFDEIINSSGASNDNEANNEDKEVQTEKVENSKCDAQTQTDINVSTVANAYGRKDAGVQCDIYSRAASSFIPSSITQEQQHRQSIIDDNNINNSRLNYLEPIKRALYETSTTLRNRTSKQRPVSMNNNIRPTPTVSTPTSLSMKKQQLKQNTYYRNTNTVTSIKRSESTATTIGSSNKSKLLTYAAKYNNIATLRSSTKSSNHENNNDSNNNNSDYPMALLPAPIPSISIANSRHQLNSSRASLTTTITPCASISDSLTAINRRYSSRTTGSSLSPSDTTVHTLSEGVTSRTASISSSEEEEETISSLVVQSVTQTMIGNWLWKNTRNYIVGKNGISHRKGHMRYVWVHPYTRTLYWGPTQPGVDHDESKSKRAFIKDIWSIPCTENPCPRVPYNLLIRTSARDLIFHAQNMEQHHQWIVALCYLLGRPNVAFEKNPSHTFSSHFDSSIHESNNSSLKIENNTSTTSNTEVLSDSMVRVGEGDSLTQDHQTEEDCDSDDSEDFINIRQCCNGKHDISTLARK